MGTDIGRNVLEQGAAVTRESGSAAALLAAMHAPLPDLVTQRIVAMGRSLGDLLVVRSSTSLDHDPTWAGTFASLTDVQPGELPHAVRACLASVFSRPVFLRMEAAGLSLHQLKIAVLIQPQIAARAGGTARVTPEGSVIVDAVLGNPAPLLSGWTSGERAEVTVDGSVFREDESNGSIGLEVFSRTARLAFETAGQLGSRTIEWGDVEGEMILLQARGSSRHSSALDPQIETGASHPVGPRLARLVTAFGGPLGDELILPWAVGLEELPDRVQVPQLTASGALVRASRLAAELTSIVWQKPEPEALRAARRSLARLRVLTPAVLDQISELRSPPERDAARVLSFVQAAGEELVARGVLMEAEEVWQRPADYWIRLPDQRTQPGRGSWSRRSAWQPFVQQIVRAAGSRHVGTPAAGGVAAGWLTPADGHVSGSRTLGSVLIVPRPLPHLAPFLWQATGLVARTGSPAAHLVEVARSLHVPAVVSCSSISPAQGALTVVDGGEGAVYVLE